MRGCRDRRFGGLGAHDPFKSFHSRSRGYITASNAPRSDPTDITTHLDTFVIGERGVPIVAPAFLESWGGMKLYMSRNQITGVHELSWNKTFSQFCRELLGS